MAPPLALTQTRSTPLRLAAEAVGRAQRMLVLTGAGISAESGLPVYRGPGGAYETDPNLADLLSAEGWSRDPDAVWRYLDQFRGLAGAALPGVAHRILAEWEGSRRFAGFLIATQNIDGLHQAAGSDRVSELHGSLWRMARPRPEGAGWAEDDSFSQEAGDWLAAEAEDADRERLLRKWSLENRSSIWEDRQVPFRTIPPYRDELIRPDVLLFGEDYGDRLLWVEWFLEKGVDVILVIGCSGGVSIVPRLLRRTLQSSPEALIVHINPHHDGIREPHLHLPLSAAEALRALWP